MTKRLRDPYLVKVRGAYLGEPDKDHAQQLYGSNQQKGVEIVLATEHGALVARTWGQGGATMLKVQLMPWKDFAGRMVGASQVLFAGPIDGQWSEPSVIKPPKTIPLPEA